MAFNVQNILGVTFSNAMYRGKSIEDLEADQVHSYYCAHGNFNAYIYSGHEKDRHIIEYC